MPAKGMLTVKPQAGGRRKGGWDFWKEECSTGDLLLATCPHG
jgi:hypothetical protein